MSDASRALSSAPRPALLKLAHRLASLSPRGLARFLGVGVGGLSVDIAVLWLLEQAGIGHALARFGSLSLATLVTWALNRQFTFGESGRGARSEFGRYAVVALVAQSVNYLVFLGVCAVWPHLNHSLAALIGAVVATGFSYTGQRFFTFAPARAG
jgi:putative flippase GtrA